MVYRSQISHGAYFKDFNSKLKVFFFTGFKEFYIANDLE